MPSGYEKSADYGGPAPTWWGMALLVLVVVVVVAVGAGWMWPFAPVSPERITNSRGQNQSSDNFGQKMGQSGTEAQS